jgi:iron complex transport system permease protein
MIAVIVISLFVALCCPFIPGGYENEFILWTLRIPRVMTAFIAGGGLALAGLVFQALFRNDLASPYILGISSAGSLGSNLAIFFGLGHFFITSLNFVFSLFSVAIITLVSKVKKVFHPSTILLTGVAIGMISSSAIMFLQVFSSERDLMQMTRWLMGSLNIVGFYSFMIIAPFVLVSLVITYFYAGELNLLSVDDEFSQTRGVNIERTRKVLFVIGSLITAPIVTEIGPIGFVGLVIPHIIKKFFKRDHRQLIILCFFSGGAFLCLCDLLSRLILSNGVMPIGVITSLIGAPIFLSILMGKRSYSN